jgi:hypothetical protein
MRKKSAIITYVLLLALLLHACGEEKQAENGSWGSDRTNIRVYAEVVSETDKVDICNSVDNYAVAFINTSVINDNLPDNVLYLEKYSFEFEPVDVNSPPIAPGSLTSKRQLPANDMKLIMVDSDRKKKYLEDLGAGTYSTNDSQAYSVTYTFKGADEYGSDFGIVAGTEFSMGKYTACTLSVLPAEISIVGVSNPETPEDTSDDVTFHISGGSGPYTVYSDNTALIPSPGELGARVSEFTIDPGSILTSTKVILTVVDSTGASATATVTVIP